MQTRCQAFLYKTTGKILPLRLVMKTSVMILKNLSRFWNE